MTTDLYRGLRPEFLANVREFEEHFAALADAKPQTKAWRIVLSCGFRTLQEQAALYAIGRRGKKGERRVTRAKAGESPHNFGLAADFIFLRSNGSRTYDGPWRLFGQAAKAAGLTWGGSWRLFKDRPHIEMPNWRKISKMTPTVPDPDSIQIILEKPEARVRIAGLWHEGATWAPLRAVGEFLGADIRFDADQRTVVVHAQNKTAT